MTKKEFDRLYSAYRLYKQLNENFENEMNDAAFRVIEEKRSELFKMVVGKYGLELNFKFFKMQDSWRFSYDRYKRANWVTRAYQRKYTNINQAGWDRIIEMRERITNYQSGVLHRLLMDDIPF